MPSLFAAHLQTYNQWSMVRLLKEANYPNMTLVGDKNETFDDAEKASPRPRKCCVP